MKNRSVLYLIFIEEKEFEPYEKLFFSSNGMCWWLWWFHSCSIHKLFKVVHFSIKSVFFHRRGIEINEWDWFFSTRRFNMQRTITSLLYCLFMYFQESLVLCIRIMIISILPFCMSCGPTRKSNHCFYHQSAFFSQYVEFHFVESDSRPISQFPRAFISQ